MTKKILKNRLICILSVFFLLGMSTIHAEGLLPSLMETVGIAMPSIGEALQRYPDSEIENEDKSTTELYTNITEEEFTIFSVYLESQGAELTNYNVEKGVLTAEIRIKGTAFRLSYDSKNGEARVTYPFGTFSEWAKDAKNHYNKTLILLDEGSVDEAVEEIIKIAQYQDYEPVIELFENNTDFAHKVNILPYKKIGNIVMFGHYEQDGNFDNGQEMIEWIVLDVQEERCFLISKYELDCLPYDDYTTDGEIIWKVCSLRTWLNSVFLQTAFNQDEQLSILTTEVDNRGSQLYLDGRGGNDPSNNTWDQVYLLSPVEVYKYFLGGKKDESNPVCTRAAPTPYAIENGAEIKYKNNMTEDKEIASSWWLRLPFGYKEICVVLSGGAVSYEYAHEKNICVRPVLWLDLNSFNPSV